MDSKELIHVNPFNSHFISDLGHEQIFKSGAPAGTLLYTLQF